METTITPPANAPSDLVRRCFAAYETKDRAALEAILSDDFTFSSPLDDNISRERYFERCWPNSGHMRSFKIEKLLAQGNEVFVMYEGVETDGSRFRNTEFFVIERDKIRHVDVYFGGEDDADDDAGGEEDEEMEEEAVEEQEVRALMERITRACRARDAAAMAEEYAPDVLAFDLIDPLRYTGAGEVRRRAEDWFSAWEGDFDYELHDLKVEAGGGTAFCHSLNHVKGTQTGGQAVDMWWRATVGCRKGDDGKWTVTHLHSSVPFDMGTGKASMGLKP